MQHFDKQWGRWGKIRHNGKERGIKMGKLTGDLTFNEPMNSSGKIVYYIFHNMRTGVGAKQTELNWGKLTRRN